MHNQFAAVRAQLGEAAVQEAFLTNQLTQLGSLLASLDQSLDTNREVCRKYKNTHSVRERVCVCVCVRDRDIEKG